MSSEGMWIAFGFAGQLTFTARMVVQWMASEKEGRSVVPLSFWYLSITGGWMLLIYALYRRDIVIISGQVLGVVVYTRNLILLHREKKANQRRQVDIPPALLPLIKPALPERRAG